MLDLLKSIATVIISLVTFVINTIKSLISLIGLIPQYVATITVAIGFLPPFVIPFITASISIYVVMFVLGRDS